MLGVKFPGTHQRYQHPELAVVPVTQKALRAGMLRLEMLYVGICGTDVHLISTDEQTGYVKSSAPALIPPEGRIIGHEGVGRISAIGDGVEGFAVGDVVSLESIVACGCCSTCRKGQPNQCEHSQLLGMEIDGVFANRADVPARLALKIPNAANDERLLKIGACLEPASVALLACKNAQIKAGDHVVIFGGGPIGIFTAMLSKMIFGAASVTVVEPIEFRRQNAQRWCDSVCSPEEFLQDGSHFDVVVEASGALDMLGNCFHRIKAAGRVCLLARTGGALTIDAVDHLLTNNISIVGSRGHLGGHFETLLNLAMTRHLPLEDVVTSVVVGIDQLYETLRNPRIITDQNCKVLCKLQ